MSTKAKEATASPPEAEAEKEPEAVTATGPRVYCGPTIKGVAKQWTVYDNGLPEAFLLQAEKTPAIEALLVPLEKFAATRINLGDPGSPESVVFRAILKQIY